MAESKKDRHYRDFSNRKAFNNIPVSEDEELVPAVLTDELKGTLIHMGFDPENVETWTLPNGKRVRVVFVPNKKGNMDNYMKIFNAEVERYLKCLDEVPLNDISTKTLEDLENNKVEQKKKYLPSAIGTTKEEDDAFFMMVLEMLIQDLEQQDEKMGKIVRLLYDGYLNKEILEMIDLGKGKTQGYAFIEKTKKAAQKIYKEKFN